MILEVSWSDFRFFHGENTLSFSADARTKRLLSNAYPLEGRRLLKSVGIFGANNSGKSNIVALFSLLKKVLSGSKDFVCNRALFGDAHRTRFSLTYNNHDGAGYFRYEFVYDSLQKRFPYEKLTAIRYYEAGTPLLETIFEKDQDQKRFFALGEEHAEILSLIPSSLPILYSLELSSGPFAPLERYRASLEALGDSLEIVKMFNVPLDKTVAMLKSGEEEKHRFILSFLQDADLSIEDISYDPAPLKGNGGGEIDEKALEDYQERPESGHLLTRYGGHSVPSLYFDSNGTKKIEAFASYLYEALKEGKTLIVDELDNGLHYKLTRAIVSAFNNIANEKGQLLFTAHDLLLMDEKNLWRKDQIYFLERTPEKARLFPLKEATASLGGPREVSNLPKRYNHGDFIAVPTPDFVKEVLSLREKKERQ